ncbi:gastric triacylglycerol lipase isoform X3 [Heterocephalus glaber]|uniref:Gastric triacylglycerol lipase isoform X3 n=1 Tax=Heterocephalus glaber TaxID=10181 RepID=A0AAX6RG79_HETGA|nr:gastric triacylglycerol lipase isoform X3 [Heterocephalus glaber]
MWLLLTVTSLISALGTTHGFLGKIADSPEVHMNINQMISYWGYPCEEYDVVTEDGYILGVYRIPYGKKNSENRDAGYDVWLGNSRGNTWSRRNLYFSPDSVEFWAFSFDEMAKYDLPATIDFIVEKTGQEKIHYVGHSQGTTIGFIAFSTNLKLAKRIKTFYALAPVATVKYTESLLKKLSYIPTFLFKMIFGEKIFMPHNFFDQFLATEVCSREMMDLLCSNALFIICGFDSKNFNTSRLDVYISHNPAGTSVQDILHWAQAGRSGKFQAFNWGSPYLNMLHFNQSTPPFYNVTAMSVPIAVWNGGNDLLADPRDVNDLLPKLSNLIYHKEILPYNHLDFIWAMNAPQEIYNEIVSMMAEDKN